MTEAIDTHSHFNLRQFDSDREAAIARMEANKVATICVGVDYRTSLFAAQLAANHEHIWAIVGQHPTEWHQEFNMHAFIALAQAAKVVGIGECGLDYYRERERQHISEQKKLFERQIALAKEMDLPLMLHIRPTARQGLAVGDGDSDAAMDAYEDALEMLKQWKKQWPTMRGTAHFFVGDNRTAQEFLDLGFYISFSGVITIFPQYEEVVRYVPLDRILSETDAPFAAPLPWRGKRCEPQYVLEVIKKIAEIKKVDFIDIQNQLLMNARILFNLTV